MKYLCRYCTFSKTLRATVKCEQKYNYTASATLLPMTIWACMYFAASAKSKIMFVPKSALLKIHNAIKGSITAEQYNTTHTKMNAKTPKH